jgi:amino acid transporter
LFVFLFCFVLFFSSPSLVVDLGRDYASPQETSGESDPLLFPSSLLTEKSINNAELLPRRTMGLFQLIIIGYFVTCGGPFGIEPAMGAGGPVLTIVGLCLIVLFWCIPQALVSAELSLLTGSNGGAIVWSERAFGGVFSFLSMCNLLFSNTCSVTMSLVLFINYFQHYLSSFSAVDQFLIVFFVKLGVLLLSSVCVALGPKIVSGMSFVIGVILFVPFFAILVVLAQNGTLSHVDYGSAMRDIPSFAEIPWGVFVSTLVWALGGFDSVGVNEK